MSSSNSSANLVDTANITNTISQLINEILDIPSKEEDNKEIAEEEEENNESKFSEAYQCLDIVRDKNECSLTQLMLHIRYLARKKFLKEKLILSKNQSLIILIRNYLY